MPKLSGFRLPLQKNDSMIEPYMLATLHWRMGRFCYQWQAAPALIGPIQDTLVESTIFDGNDLFSIANKAWWPWPKVKHCRPLGVVWALMMSSCLVQLDILHHPLNPLLELLLIHSQPFLNPSGFLLTKLRSYLYAFPQHRCLRRVLVWKRNERYFQ